MVPPYGPAMAKFFSALFEIVIFSLALFLEKNRIYENMTKSESAEKNLARGGP